jgi:nicotinamidase/pyrazinamidase
VNSWPSHCVAGTNGAEYHPAIDVARVDVHVLKGQGVPAYSAFDGRADDGRSITEVFAAGGVDGVDIVGIATDYCVRATALDAIAAGFAVTVKANLCVGVSPASSVAALGELAAAGVVIEVQ